MRRRSVRRSTRRRCGESSCRLAFPSTATPTEPSLFLARHANGITVTLALLLLALCANTGWGLVVVPSRTTAVRVRPNTGVVGAPNLPATEQQVSGTGEVSTPGVAAPTKTDVTPVLLDALARKASVSMTVTAGLWMGPLQAAAVTVDYKPQNFAEAFLLTVGPDLPLLVVCFFIVIGTDTLKADLKEDFNSLKVSIDSLTAKISGKLDRQDDKINNFRTSVDLRLEEFESKHNNTRTHE